MRKKNGDKYIFKANFVGFNQEYLMRLYGPVSSWCGFPSTINMVFVHKDIPFRTLEMAE
ncbi:hypothetical protein OAT96_00095 [Chitinophagales bacterium]|nr:hypothetical protein [Chitinophagales bacterium]